LGLRRRANAEHRGEQQRAKRRMTWY